MGSRRRSSPRKKMSTTTTSLSTNRSTCTQPTRRGFENRPTITVLKVVNIDKFANDGKFKKAAEAFFGHEEEFQRPDYNKRGPIERDEDVTTRKVLFMQLIEYTEAKSPFIFN
jgi:hypothetical protein